jgi:hypothetical protein
VGGNRDRGETKRGRKNRDRENGERQMGEANAERKLLNILGKKKRELNFHASYSF